MAQLGLIIGVIMALVKVIEKLIDSKMSKPSSSNTQAVAMQLAAIAETTSATGQTLERINDKLDEMDMRHAAMATLTGAIDGRVKDIQSTAHKVHVLCEAQDADIKERKLFEKLKASQSGTNPAVA